MAHSVDLMLAELPLRDGWAEVMTIGLADSKNLPISLRANRWRIFPCADQLSMTTIVPSWSKGWHRILTDEAAYLDLTWFLHFARQYIHRADVAKLLMIAWDRDERVLHPFAPKTMYSFYGPHLPMRSNRAMLDAAVAGARREWGDPVVEIPITSVWAKANTLDPNLHQAVFHFVRGHSLLQHDFELEAVVAFDCALQAIKTLLLRGGLVTNKSSPADLCCALGLEGSAPVALEAKFLRNAVGAHAGGWRWWDSGDITEELAPAASKLVRRALAKAARIEPTIRTIDPSPESWSQWLLSNFDMLWDTVWLDKK